MSRGHVVSHGYTMEELNYIRMHQRKQIEKKARIINNFKVTVMTFVCCAAFVFGLFGARSAFWSNIEDTQVQQTEESMISEADTFFN